MNEQAGTDTMALNPKARFETLARLGYAARGFVYCLVGGLAVLGSMGPGGHVGGSRPAIATLLEQPFGKGLLFILALGLAAFSCWRVVEGVFDADHQGRSYKALALRSARVGAGVIYASLGLFSVSLALGHRTASGAEDKAARDWTAWLLAQPFGRWLVAAIGVGVVCAGLSYLVRSWRADVTRYLALGGKEKHWAVPLGRFGFAARGVVFLLVGSFLALAALQSNSREVKGLGGALESLQSQPYGSALLAITAAGLFSFGLFGFVQARYRRIEPPTAEDAKRLLQAR